jgi:hypothetical protein
MARTDREVFDLFLTDPGCTREIALLAFASYAPAKHDWIGVYEQQHGAPPTEPEVERWIAELPPSRFSEIRDTAIAFFEEAATAYMQSVIEEERAKAVGESILAEVRRLNQDLAGKVVRATSFWGTVWGNLLIGIAASFGFTVLVILGGLIFEKDPSPFAITKHLLNEPGAVDHPPAKPPAASPAPRP